jgi:hypothetical protein
MFLLLLACASPESDLVAEDIDNAPDLVTAEFNGDLTTWIVAEVTCMNADGSGQFDDDGLPYGYKGAQFDDDGIAVIIDEVDGKLDHIDLDDCPRVYISVWDSYGPTTDPTVILEELTAVIDDQVWVPLANGEWDELAGLEFEPA